MLLRASSQASEVNLTSVVNANTESGIPHGTPLIAFADAVLGDDDAALEAARKTVLTELGPDALVDSAAVVATFMQMDRIADATGIPVDGAVLDQTRAFRTALGLNHFASARNTLGTSA